jgi:hypothetical protein
MLDVGALGISVADQAFIDDAVGSTGTSPAAGGGLLS